MKRFINYLKETALYGWQTTPSGMTDYHESTFKTKNGNYSIDIAIGKSPSTNTHHIDFMINGHTSSKHADVHPDDKFAVTKYIGTHIKNYIKNNNVKKIKFAGQDSSILKQNTKNNVYKKGLIRLGAKRITQNDDTSYTAHFEEYLYEEVLKRI